MEILHLVFHPDLSSLVRIKNKRSKSFSDAPSLDFPYPLTRRASIKDIVECVGIPHTEVGLIKKGDQHLRFDYIPCQGERLHIYPHRIPFSGDNYLFDEPLYEKRFVVDVNIGRLAKLLRMLGIDCAYNWRWNDDKIVEVARKERRIVLTRDMELLKRKDIIWGRFIRSIYPGDQLQEVCSFFGLNGPFNILSRCLVCNEPLVSVEKDKIIHRLEPKTKKYYFQFAICPRCNRIYWPGSHFEKMRRYISSLKIQRKEGEGI